MKLPSLVKKVGEWSGLISRETPIPEADIYDQDGLRSVHNHDFTREVRFREAYARGVVAAQADYKWQWRVHVGLWAAHSASKLEGDFVECGVNRGFLSSAIMRYLDWDSLGKTFYLLDTFHGLDERYVSAQEISRNKLELNKQDLQKGFYTTRVDLVRENFSQWRKIQIVEGSIPDTLVEVKAKEIAYLHLDMNCAPPEVAALKFFWDRLVPGAFVLMDDYAYIGFEPQKAAMDEVAALKGLKILSLPTGQGILIKSA